MINDSTIVYLIEVCKYCTIDTYTKMTHKKVYNLYENFCKENSITPLAKDNDEYLKKYQYHFFNITQYMMRRSNFGRFHHISGCNPLHICKRCKENGAHLPDEVEKLRKENAKLKALLLSQNLNKDMIRNLVSYLIDI